MTLDPSQSSAARADNRQPANELAEYELASFPGASIVQVIGGDPLEADADIIELGPARVVVTDRRIIAVDGSDDWSWHIGDLEGVIHGRDGGWSMFVVPGIADFGVAVAPTSVDAFRRAVGALPGVMVHHQREGRSKVIDPGLLPHVAAGPSLSPRPDDTHDTYDPVEGTDGWAESTSAATFAAIQELERAIRLPFVDASGSLAGRPITNRTPVVSPSDAPVAAPQAGATAVTGQLPVTPAPTSFAPPPGPPPAAATTSAPLSGPPAAPPTMTASSSNGSTATPFVNGSSSVTMGGSRVPAGGPPPSGPPRPAPRSRPISAEAARGAGFGLRGRPAATTMADIVPPDAALAGIDARNISAWFGSHQVLDRVSLDMEAGRVTALIGPSGCGKSTFLRILNRMHEMIPGAAMGGEVFVDGHDLYDAERKLTDARREVGMVFQKPNPFPAMSIYDNVLASFRLTGVKATTSLKDEIVETCLSKAGLWNEVKDRLRQPGGGLSGGQQQRLCIARALSIKPRVPLMDEPCSALDPTSTRRIEETIMQIVSEVTIVIVTHNMQQASRVSNHCAFFLAEQGTPGVIVEHGPTDAMFGNPQDPRTSDYVLGRFG